MIAWDSVPVANALAGGALIGLSATLLLGLTGRLAGISGIAAGLLRGNAKDWGWRVAFLAGLVGGAALVHHFAGTAPVARAGFPPWLLVVAGLLVGYGTALSNGCTSGHGVCGMARLSARSLAATGIFLVTAIATTFLVRHVAGLA
jgi:uncharacterized membrane protein YedE/YeeE